MGLNEIIDRHEHPIIGVVGATSPLPGYSDKTGIELGYRLREVVEKKGSIFTGGVYGVGLDVYRGVVNYCQEHNVNDKFFCLWPDFDYNPPEEYFNLAEQTNHELIVEKIGKDLEERRRYVGEIADILIVVNGSSGTLEEAISALKNDRALLCLENSGGAAEFLGRLKRGEVKKPQTEFNTGLINCFNSINQIINYLSSKYLEKVG